MADLEQIFPPARPLGPAIFEQCTLHRADDFFRTGRQRTRADLGQEGHIAFLLPRDNVADDHGASDGQGLLHDGSAGLADEKMAFGQQLRHALGPAQEAEGANRQIEPFQNPCRCLCRPVTTVNSTPGNAVSPRTTPETVRREPEGK